MGLHPIDGSLPRGGHGYAFFAQAASLCALRSANRVTDVTARAKLSSKFQISIPKAVRDAHAWKVGQEFVFIPRGRGVIVMPAPELDELVGIARDADRVDHRDRNDRF